MPKFNTGKTNKLRKFDNLVKKVLFFKTNKALPPIVKDDVKEIILLCMYLIGDTIMFIPVLSVLKNNFPNAKITIVCGRSEEIILKKQGLVDRFVLAKCPWMSFDYSVKNIINFFTRLRPINKIKYDLAMDFRGDWRNIFFMNFIRAKRKISYNFTGGEYMLTDAIHPDPEITHYIEEAFFLLKQIGCDFSGEDKLPVLKLSSEDEIFLTDFKRTNGLDNQFIFGIHPGASLEIKRWDERKFSELIVRVTAKHPGIAVLIYEGPNERNTVNTIENVLKEKKTDFIVINKNLEEYTRLLSICNMVVCNDSGAAHIACAFSIPTVVIYGNVDPLLVSPYGSKMLKIVSHDLFCKPCHQSSCKYGTSLCIKMVSVDEVYDAVTSIMNIVNNTAADLSYSSSNI
jgi:lipopolysaccharide heptosyltransferase II